MSATPPRAPLVPYVAPGEHRAEFTIRAVVLGALLSLTFGMVNSYLALKIGLTVSASIPSAVMSMGTVVTAVAPPDVGALGAVLAAAVPAAMVRANGTVPAMARTRAVRRGADIG